MKVHTTNYYNTFIEVAADCPAAEGEIPPLKGNSRSVANIQFDIIYNNPYIYTSDEVLFQVFTERNNLTPEDLDEFRKQFFSKGQPCFRASPLTKRYGWGIHSDKDGKIAIFGRETEEYKKFACDSDLKVVRAMNTSRKKQT